MKLYLHLSLILISTVFLGSCKKSDDTNNNNNQTVAQRFKQYEGTWQVAETPLYGGYSGGTRNYQVTITVNDDGSLTITNLGEFHKTITAAYRDNGGNDVHEYNNIIVDISSNTTSSAYFTFQTNLSAKTLNGQITYIPNGGGSSNIYSNINAQKI